MNRSREVPFCLQAEALPMNLLSAFTVPCLPALAPLGPGPTAFPAHTVPSVVNREQTLRDPEGPREAAAFSLPFLAHRG